MTACLFLADHSQVTDVVEIRFDGWTLRPRSGELLRDGSMCFAGRYGCRGLPRRTWQTPTMQTSLRASRS